ncbi:hydrogenase nickel incorporation protein HypB [Calditrichota bacterium]
MEIIVAKNILNANDQIAVRIQTQLEEANVYGINLMGSPGSGKTTLIESLNPHLQKELDFGVIEGDLATSRDAERMEKLGISSVQINTGGGCHLDANMVDSSLQNFDIRNIDLLFIDNVGNLVCTASFKLGEHLRVVVLSVTEGDDKVGKYPYMFQKADALIINKMDLIEYTDFDLARIKSDISIISPKMEILLVSAKTGEGIEALAKWLVEKRNTYLTSQK